MMSYLWILLLGSLLASRAKAQVNDGPADVEPVFFDDPEDETEVSNTATEEPQPAAEIDPAAEDPAAEEAEAENPAASDPEEVIPEGGEEPEAAEEGSEEATTDAADPAVDLVEGGEETTTLAADLAGDIGEEISTTAEPEPLETTTSTEEEDLPIEASGDTATPTPTVEEIITTTTASPEQEISTTTPALLPVVPVEEAEETTTTAATTTAATTTTEVEEIPLVNEAPADSKEVTAAADVSGVDETTTGPFIDKFADQVEEAVVKVHKDSRKIFASAPIKDPADTHDTPKADDTSSKPLAAVLSGIVVAAVGAVAAYFTYQKKKLCFKNRQADPETGNKGEKADPADSKSNPETLAPLVDQKS